MVKIRTYPHFDAALTETDAVDLISDPLRVAKHSFFPFIEYSEKWTKYAAKGCKGALKSRPIKYASRRDSCIYSHYRTILAQAYEAEIARRGIGSAVLAYRRIPKLTSKGNKSNIHFAGDVFSEIRQQKNCIVCTLDISKFFDSLNHSTLKRRWMQIMHFDTMPLDHYCVFRNVTRYATVSREDLYRQLNFIGKKSVRGRQVMGYLINRVPLQVCSGKVFREKIVPLIKTNPHDCGIPQGSPISDVLANLYMLDFDSALVDMMNKIGGSYRRYSDDILLVIPGHGDDYSRRLASVELLLQKCGKELKMQPAKSTVHRFAQTGKVEIQTCERISGSAGRNGLEYLGFRFDGTRVFIRDSTRSRLQRKMTFSVNATVGRLCRKHPSLPPADLKRLFDPNWVWRQFYKVRDFEAIASTPNKWTFWTYVIRAQKVFDAKDKPLAKQLRNFRRSISYRADRLIDKRNNRAGHP